MPFYVGVVRAVGAVQHGTCRGAFAGPQAFAHLKIMANDETGSRLRLHTFRFGTPPVGFNRLLFNLN